MPLIRDEGFIVVTNNGRDFLPLLANEGIHPGLVIIVPGGIVRDIQLRLFGRALDVIGPMTDLVNKVVEVELDGRVEVRDWP